jgi:hypothetical protein
MARGKDKIKKAKKERAPEAGGAQKKGMNIAGKGKRVATGPPGSPQGSHHQAMAKAGSCRCGRCSNERIAV